VKCFCKYNKPSALFVKFSCASFRCNLKNLAHGDDMALRTRNEMNRVSNALQQILTTSFEHRKKKVLSIKSILDHCGNGPVF